jgi:hypothetical protein
VKLSKIVVVVVHSADSASNVVCVGNARTWAESCRKRNGMTDSTLARLAAKYITYFSSVVESDVSGNFVCNVAEFDSVGIVYTLSVTLQVVEALSLSCAGADMRLVAGSCCVLIAECFIDYFSSGI